MTLALKPGRGERGGFEHLEMSRKVTEGMSRESKVQGEESPGAKNSGRFGGDSTRGELEERVLGK